jgi:hypothetical protein
VGASRCIRRKRGLIERKCTVPESIQRSISCASRGLWAAKGFTGPGSHSRGARRMATACPPNMPGQWTIAEDKARVRSGVFRPSTVGPPTRANGCRPAAGCAILLERLEATIPIGVTQGRRDHRPETRPPPTSDLRVSVWQIRDLPLSKTCDTVCPNRIDR